MEYKRLEENDIDLMDSFIDDSDTKYQKNNLSFVRRGDTLAWIEREA